MAAIPFTQYLLPDGRTKAVALEQPEPVAAKAQQIIDAGYRFECEVLNTGEVSFTIHDPDEEQDVAIEVCTNGPDVIDAVGRLIEGFDPHPAAAE